MVFGERVEHGEGRRVQFIAGKLAFQFYLLLLNRPRLEFRLRWRRRLGGWRRRRRGRWMVDYRPKLNVKSSKSG
jgi:hypothetical protein